MPYSNPEAQREFQARWHQENKERRKASDRVRKERDREIIRAKKAVPCADCGNSYPYWIMQFDHTGTDKVADVSRLLSNRQIKKALEEIEKCEVVCANCHMTRTHTRRLRSSAEE